MASTRRLVLIAGIAFAFLAVPAAAGAATRYVDFDTGNDAAGTNDCLTIGTPCKSIGQALTQSGSAADTIQVDDDTYAEAGLTVASGKTLTGLDFVSGDTGDTIVDPGSSASPVITASGGATVSNLTVRNDSARLVEVSGPATITGNTFDEENIGSPTPHLLILSTAGDPTITGNHFHKLSSGGTAIRSLSTGSPTISNNTINHYNGALDLQAGTPTVTGNDVANETASGSCDPCGGIYIQDAQATLTGNTLHDPIAATPRMISIQEFAAGLAASATLTRNVISGGDVGVYANQAAGAIGPVTLSGDLISGYSANGLRADNAPSQTITATNVTLASSQPGVTADIALNGSQHLVLDSSIVSNQGITTTAGATCEITFSRGPTATPDGNGCDNFQTTADPLFTSSTDLHLQPGSPMIDAGNPTAPAIGAVDIDDDPRAVDGTVDCATVARRDIGADEFVPTTTADCTPPNTIILSGTSGITSDNTPTFAFSSTESPSTFRCAVDGGPFTSCVSPHTTSPLTDGSHVFKVKARDASLNEDPVPATRSFTVKTASGAPQPASSDLTPPETTLTAHPKKKSGKRKARFEFASSEAGSSFLCSVDGKGYAPCASPFVKKKLKPGKKHRFDVVAVDPAGNQDQTPASFRWRVLKKK